MQAGTQQRPLPCGTPGLLFPTPTHTPTQQDPTLPLSLLAQLGTCLLLGLPAPELVPVVSSP